MARLLLIGTAKGLVVFEKKEHYVIKEVHFLGFPVGMVYVDERTNTWWIGLDHRHWGPKLHRSIDEGKTWEELPLPKYPDNAILPSGKKAFLKKIWVMQHGGEDRPGTLWMGTEPGGLFFSANNGDHFQLVEALWNHPSRKNEMQWFGAGRDYPFIHSILVNPQDSNHIYIAVSCAGVFESKDAGNNWQVRNKGLLASYLPNPKAEYGHDPHCMRLCKNNPAVMWQQNHCGVFKSLDAGLNWKIVSDKKGLADYGFALAIDEERPERAWVIPAVSDEMRVAQNLKLTVSYTEDGGQNWRSLDNGLPQEKSFDMVFRHAFLKRKELMLFGTNNGNVYLSENEGTQWQCISSNLARIDSVAFVD